MRFALIGGEVIAGIQLFKFFKGMVVHLPLSICGPLQGGVMDNNNVPIAARVDVKLGIRYSSLQSQAKSGKGILRCFSACPSMSKDARLWTGKEFRFHLKFICCLPGLDFYNKPIWKLALACNKVAVDIADPEGVVNETNARRVKNPEATSCSSLLP